MIRTPLNVPRLQTLGLAALIAAAGVMPAAAAPTQVLTESQVAEFANGELRQVALDQEGVLRPARELGEPVDLGAALAWTAVGDGAGGHYVALGSEARVIRLTAEGKVEPVHAFSEGLVRALAVDAAGFLYVGTSIPGRVYRVNAEGRAEIWHDAAESYIWDLLADADGGLLVATGAPGKVYRLPPGHRAGGEVEAWWSAPGGHVTSLVRAPDGAILAGTSGDGLLVRLEAADKARILWATEGAEVRAILPDVDGSIMFATFPPSAATSPTPTSAQQAAANAQANRQQSPGASTAGASPQQPQAGTVTIGEPMTTTPAGSMLLRWTADGFVRPVWAPTKGGIFSLAVAGEGRTFVGTNDSGRLFEVRADGTWSLIQQTPQGTEISRLLQVGEGGVALLTSHPARWYPLGASPAAEAVYTSSSLDARQPARWASLQVDAEDGGPAAVAAKVRTGHTNRPGPTWSDWREATPAEAGRWEVGGDPARFLQYQLTFSDPAASVRRVRAFARTANQAPVIAAVRVLPHAFEPMRPQASPPTFDLRRLLDERQVENLVRDPNAARQQFRHAPADGMITVAWRAGDPDGDDLRFRVSLRPEPAGEWLVVADDLAEPSITVSTRGLREGLYRARVEASDAVDNDPADALTTSRDSEPFTIDLTPPELNVESAGERRWRVTATDAHSLIRRAWYQVDGGTEVRLRPEDGVFDQRRETFLVDGTRWPVGAQTVIVAVEDEAGRTAVAAWSLR